MCGLLVDLTDEQQDTLFKFLNQLSNTRFMGRPTCRRAFAKRLWSLLELNIVKCNRDKLFKCLTTSIEIPQEEPMKAIKALDRMILLQPIAEAEGKVAQLKAIRGVETFLFFCRRTH
mmetsp:Transcript_18159/g.32066  ORF Transcript_18159/g.32066 Transcript_18159/m.32066 type:complete len:117 (+) Transcript_18159:162-512(+)